MANLAVFLYPNRVGISRIKSAGFKPCFAPTQWRTIDNALALVDEPMQLASLIREMLGDEKRCTIYLNLWPGAYSEVMFSYDKKRSRDLKRLRQAELETVFHGEFSKMYTYDLLMDKGRATDGSKSRRVIYSIPKARIRLLKEAFSARKLSIARVAPMDVVAAESALHYWSPNRKMISVCLTLDEACTSVAFFRGGTLCAIRTLPNGFNSVLSTYMEVTGQDIDTCLDMLRSNGVIVPTEKFDMTAIQDDVMRVLNRISVEAVKTLHNTFGDEAVIDQVLLCGNFSHTVGLADYLNTMLNTTCTVAGAAEMKDSVTRAIVLQDEDLGSMFHLAATTAKGTDLLWEMRKIRSDRISAALLCSVMVMIAAGIMAIAPYRKHLIQQELDAAAHIMEQPEYVEVRELFDARSSANRDKANLAAAIEALPHGATNSAGIMEDLLTISSEYGTVQTIRCDYSGKEIDISMTMLSYEAFISWQTAITADGRYAFEAPPSFNGNGLIYSVGANITAAEFDAANSKED